MEINIENNKLIKARTANRRLAKKRDQCLNEALCFEIRFFAKRQNVRCKRGTTDRVGINRHKRRTKMPTLRKIKRGVLPMHMPTQKTPHLILPKRTQNPPTTRQLVNNFCGLNLSNTKSLITFGQN